MCAAKRNCDIAEDSRRDRSTTGLTKLEADSVREPEAFEMMAY